MQSYTFKASGYRVRLSDRNDVFHFSYEKDGLFYMGSIKNDGEFNGIMKGLDPNGDLSPQMHKLKGVSLKKATELCGYWFDEPLIIKNIQKSKIKPGYFYPRVWRPFKDHDTNITEILIGLNQQAFNAAIISVNGLLARLKSIFSTVSPDHANLGCFGHEIRNLLLLGCMEVEASLKGVLKANGCSKTRHNTSDYVKLRDPLNLEKYSVSFKYYPQLGSISPFKGWDENNPTTSLVWYDMYNATKHDREANFNVATLGQAIESVCAAKILLHAQYGDHYDLLNNELANLVVHRDRDIYEGNYYIPNHKEEWKPITLPSI